MPIDSPDGFERYAGTRDGLAGQIISDCAAQYGSVAVRQSM